MRWSIMIFAAVVSMHCFALFSSASNLGLVGDTVEKQIIAYLTDPLRYTKNDRPPTDSNEPVTVDFKAFIYYLKGSSKTNNMHLQMLIEMRWIDSRLKFNGTANNLTMIYGEQPLIQEIWCPEIYLINVDLIRGTPSLEKDDAIIIEPSGSVIMTTRMKTVVECTLHMTSWFPFDEKICTLEISTLWLNSTELLLRWSNATPESYEDGISPDEFYLEAITTSSSEETDDCDELCMRGQSKLTVRFNLKRRYGFYLIDYYLPCCLLVMMSWLSFWFDPDAVPARVSIGTNAILNFLQLNWNEEVVDSSGVKATDIWAMTCSAFLFVALIEFAFVNTIDRRGPERVVLKKKSSKYIFQYSVSRSPKHRLHARRSSTVPSSPEIRKFARGRPMSKVVEELRNEDFVSEVNQRVKALAEEIKKEEEKAKRKKSIISDVQEFFTMTPHEVAMWIDKKSRFMFPLGFLVFNLVYWSFLYLPEALF